MLLYSTTPDHDKYSKMVKFQHYSINHTIKITNCLSLGQICRYTPNTYLTSIFRLKSRF
eukprot:UN00803